MKFNIAVIGGGDSAEIEISLLSQQTVIDNLDVSKYNVYKVMLVDKKWTVEIGQDKLPVDLNDFSFTYKGRYTKFDFAFIVIHGTPGEDGIIQGYFDLKGIPYNTPGHMTSTMTFNKWACNHVLRSIGFNCAKSVLVRKGVSLDAEGIVKTLGLPLFVKPNDGGSSFGVTKVKEAEQIMTAIDTAFEHGSEVIIEECLSGTEVTCGVITRDGVVTALPVTEIVSETEFFDYEAKYKGLSKEITPARLEASVYKKVQYLTEEVYKSLGLKGMTRVDFIIVNDVPYVMEINTVPGLSPESIIPQQAREIGMSLTELFSLVIDQSLN